MSELTEDEQRIEREYASFVHEVYLKISNNRSLKEYPDTLSAMKQVGSLPWLVLEIICEEAFKKVLESKSIEDQFRTAYHDLKLDYDVSLDKRDDLGKQLKDANYKLNLIRSALRSGVMYEVKNKRDVGHFHASDEKALKIIIEAVLKCDEILESGNQKIV